MKRRHGLKAFGLSLFTGLGLMAFTVGGAQAHDWLIGGKALTGLAASETITGEQVGASELLILNLNLILKCTTLTVSNASIVAGGTGSGELRFSDCDILDHKGIKGPCTFVEPIVAKVKAQLVLHTTGESTKVYVLFSPQDLLTFTTFKTTGGECPLPESATIKGSVLFLIVKNNANPMVITTSGTLALLGHTLKYGANVAHLTKTMNVVTTGKYIGQTLGAH